MPLLSQAEGDVTHLSTHKYIDFALQPASVAQPSTAMSSGPHNLPSGVCLATSTGQTEEPELGLTQSPWVESAQLNGRQVFPRSR